MKNVALLSGLCFIAFGLAGCAAETGEEEAAAISQDELTAAAPLGAEPKGSPARFPIVLAHGFLGNGEGFASFNAQIGDALEKDGHIVVRGSVPPLGNVNIRAKALAHDIDEALN